MHDAIFTRYVSVEMCRCAHISVCMNLCTCMYLCTRMHECMSLYLYLCLYVSIGQIEVVSVLLSVLLSVLDTQAHLVHNDDSRGSSTSSLKYLGHCITPFIYNAEMIYAVGSRARSNVYCTCVGICVCFMCVVDAYLMHL